MISSPDEKNTYDMFAKGLDVYMNTHKKIVDLVKSGEQSDALQLMYHQSATQYNDAGDFIDQVDDIQSWRRGKMPTAKLMKFALSKKDL